jgi:hypothetical protein
MALQRRIHSVVELLQLTRIVPDQMRPEFLQPGANALGIRRQIERPQRTDFAVPHVARVRLDAHNRAVKHRDRLPAGPFVAALPQGQVHPVGKDSCNAHGSIRGYLPSGL